MDKKLIRLTESDLHNIVKESVNRILKEDVDVDYLESRREEMLQKIKVMINKIDSMISEYANEFGKEYVEDDERLNAIWKISRNFSMLTT